MRRYQATAIVFLGHLGMNPGQQGFQPARHAADIATGAGFQVAGGFEDFPVVMLNRFVHVTPLVGLAGVDDLILLIVALIHSARRRFLLSGVVKAGPADPCYTFTL